MIKKIETKQPAVAAPVLQAPQVKKFTEAFKSTNPIDQIDQIIAFYNSFAPGKDFHVKMKTTFTSESPNLLLKQIYVVQELYIKHIGRLPFAEELRVMVWIGDDKKMSELLNDRPKALTKNSIALQALGLEFPLNINNDAKPKTI